jgi:hypothetical protein
MSELTISKVVWMRFSDQTRKQIEDVLGKARPDVSTSCDTECWNLYEARLKKCAEGSAGNECRYVALTDYYACEHACGPGK